MSYQPEPDWLQTQTHSHDDYMQLTAALYETSSKPPLFFLSWPALTWGPEAIRPLQSERCVVDCVPANPFEVLSWCDYVFVLVLGGHPNKQARVAIDSCVVSLLLDLVIVFSKCLVFEIQRKCQSQLLREDNSLILDGWSVIFPN